MIEKIDRIAIAVKNLDEAMDFFTDLLGIYCCSCPAMARITVRDIRYQIQT